MKRIGAVIALAAVALLAGKSYADVQNIRLSGDIRVRGYYLNRADAGNVIDDNFISQRTRITCEADLEDHVLVVVTLKAEGLWGSDNFNEQTSGAGQPNGKGNVINRGFDLGINEAYVQLSEVFYTPATLRLGRQYLNYGRGLILSSAEGEYNFDAARLVLDWYPVTVDVVYSRTIEGSVFGSGSTGFNANLLFLNARYEMTDSLLKDVELYWGYSASDSAKATSARVPTTLNGASPMIIGLRTDLNLTKGLKSWAEAAFEWGPDGTVANNGISAGLVNVGGNYTLADVQWSPAVNFNYTYATGGGDSGKHAFVPWFDYVDGYNGYLLHPLLSNIHIFNLGASVKPAANTTLALQAYYYLQADKNAQQVSNGNVDFGTAGTTTSGLHKEIGWEIDTILGYDYSKDVRCQLVYGVLLPETALRDTSFDAVAHEIRGELNVKF
jgi:hypothetical protein